VGIGGRAISLAFDILAEVDGHLKMQDLAALSLSLALSEAEGTVLLG
jgi:hypothetical protein